MYEVNRGTTDVHKPRKLGFNQKCHYLFSWINLRRDDVLLFLTVVEGRSRKINLGTNLFLDAVSNKLSPLPVRTGFGPFIRLSNFGDQEIGTSPALLLSAAIQHTTWPLDWTTHLFNTFVWHSKLSVLSICDFIPPKLTRGIVLPPGFSSLIDSHLSALSTHLER